MVLTSRENEIGAWSFLVGVVLAMVIGLATALIPVPALIKMSPPIYGILVLLGLIIGYFSIPGGKESQTFMIAGTVLVIVSRFGMESVTGSLIGIGIGDIITSVFSALLVLFVPATIIVALKSVFSAARV
jgi:uncharacterized RDD family membrane protein YckC